MHYDSRYWNEHHDQEHHTSQTKRKLLQKLFHEISVEAAFSYIFAAILADALVESRFKKMLADVSEGSGEQERADMALTETLEAILPSCEYFR